MLHYIENIQFICIAHQVTGFNMKEALPVNRLSKFWKGEPCFNLLMRSSPKWSNTL